MKNIENSNLIANFNMIKVGKVFQHNINKQEFIIISVNELKTLSGDEVLVHMIGVIDNNQEIYCTDGYIKEYFYPC